MEKIKILHTADLHICSPLSALGTLSQIRQNEILDAFGRIIDLAKSQEVDVILISGDLFDSPNPSSDARSYVTRKLSQIPEIKVFIALGNHEAGLDMQLPENVYLFGSNAETFEFDGFDVSGISFSNEYSDSCMTDGFRLNNTDKINLMVLHADLISSGSTSRYNPLTPSDIARTSADYVALGHIHSYSGIKTANTTAYAYCGTPEARGFDETGAKGVILGDVYKNHTDLKFIPVSKREFIEINLDISLCADYFEICDKIKESCIGSENLFKINLCGERENSFFIDTSIIYERIKDDYFFVKLNDFTRPKVNIDELSKEFSLKGLFVKKLLEKGGSDTALKCGLSAIAGEKVFFE